MSVVKISPINKYACIEKVEVEEDEKQKEENTFFVPEEIKDKDGPFPGPERFGLYQLANTSDDWEEYVEPGDLIVVENSMVETINILGRNFSFVKEQYVVCIVDEKNE